MKLTIKDGRDHFYTFDTNRILLLTATDEENIRQVEFSTEENGEEVSWTSEVLTGSDGVKYVQVPNEFLNGNYTRLVCYYVALDSNGEFTRQKEVFRIRARQEPEDYYLTYSERVTFASIKALTEQYKATTKQYMDTTEGFKDNAGRSAELASKYAENNEDVAVEPGKYSAKHWSIKAEAAKETAVQKATEAGTSEVNSKTYMESAQSAKQDAETAKNAANTILEQVQSKGTDITNFVATSKTEIETQKNESVNAVKSVYQTDLDELKGDLNDISDALSCSVSENIYNSLTFTSGYMSKTGVVYSADTLKYSNKISVKAGDVLSLSSDAPDGFRFVTAFNGVTAVSDSGAENVKTYTVPNNITSVVVTVYITESSYIAHTHKVLIDVDELRHDVDELKHDIDEELLLEYGFFDSTTLQYWGQTAQTIVYYKCKPNTKYTINKNGTTPTFEICYIKEEPALGKTQPVYNYVLPVNGTNVEYITGNDALYVLMLVGNYTDNRNYLKNNMSATSKQILVIDEKSRTIISYDEAYLPNHLYMIVNKNYEIYHSQICPKAENYTFKWNEGSNLGNRVRLNYNTTGEKLLQCNIYNADGTLAKQLRTTVHVVNITSDNIYLLSLGDSLTNHCVWQSELMNMAENIVCVGSRSRIIADSDGENRTVYNEGRAGFTSFNYTNGTSYANGLSDSGGDENPNRWYDPVNKKFSASYYFANSFPSSQHIPTMFTFFLGMNDLIGSNSCTYIAENIKSMIDDIRSYMPDIPIVLIAPQIRYLANLTGDEHLRFLEFSKTLENLSKEYINMVYIPLCYGMDSLNNYSMQDITINTRCDITEKTAIDITHPYKTGYWQIADMVLGAISYLADVN